MKTSEAMAKEVVEHVDIVVAKLVEAAQNHVAVIVMGRYGSGKNWMCDRALKQMGLEPHTFYMPAMDPIEILDKTFLDNLPKNAGVILDCIQYLDRQRVLQVALALTKFVRVNGGVAFLTFSPDDEHHRLGDTLNHLEIATGATLGLQQVVEISK